MSTVGGARAALGMAPPDLARDVVVRDDGAHLEPAGAAGACRDVDVEGPGEQRGPGHVRGGGVEEAAADASYYRQAVEGDGVF